MRGDPETASEIRRQHHNRLRTEVSGSSERSPFVWVALDEEDLDEAADALLEWHKVVETSAVDNDSDRRADCRRLIDLTIRFLNQPKANRHPASSRLYLLVSTLIYAVQSIATADNTFEYLRVNRKMLRERGILAPRLDHPPVDVGSVSLEDRLAEFGRIQFFGSMNLAVTSSSALELVEEIRPGLYAGHREASATVARLESLSRKGGGSQSGAGSFSWISPKKPAVPLRFWMLP